MNMADATEHAYRVEHMPGSLHRTIRDVVIFEECEKAQHESGFPVVFDADWLREACEAMNAAERDGYLPPVHIGMPAGGEQDECPFAGHIANVRFTDSVDGQKARLVADLVCVPVTVIDAILRCELPYRCPTVSEPTMPFVSSLGLCRTTIPMFKWPLFRVVED